jgi:hypothetical protein
MRVRDPLALLFDWPARHVVHLGLPLAVVLSVLAHAAGLMAFRLKPPPMPDILRRSAEVYFFQGGSGSLMGGVIEAANPGLFSPAAVEDPSVWQLPATRYRSSIEEWSPALLPAPPAPPLPPAPVTSTGPVRAFSPTVRRSDPPSSAPPPTRIELSGDLAARSLALPADTIFSAPPRQSLSPCEILVCAAPDGTVLHAFPLASSGNESLDQSAVRALLTARFNPLPETPSPAWGMATFLWGADLRPLPAE